MKILKWCAGLLGLAILVAAAGTGCSRHYVVVTPPDDGYSRRDTLYGRLIDDGREIRVTFRFDTVIRVDTVVRLDTLWEEGTRVDTVVQLDTVLRVDTVQAPISQVVIDTVVRTDTVLQTDTVEVMNDALPPPQTVVDTVVLTDTVRVTTTDTVVQTDTIFRAVSTAMVDTVIRTDTVTRLDTIRIATNDTVVRTDTVIRPDTIRVVTTDTVFQTDTVIRVDTVRVAGGPRYVFVPPGQYPPEGECRLWIPGNPPGQQDRPTACADLGEIPDVAFVLYGGVAWDAQWDWVATAREHPGAVPPEIVAVFRRRGG